MSVSEIPLPPTVPKPTPRRAQSSRSVVAAAVDSPELPKLLEQCTVLETFRQNDFIPEEILQVLTSTACATERADVAMGNKSKNAKDGKGGLRSIDPVWHHPLRRSRFKHLTEQPVCLTGAGRDISFLCDALLMEKKTKDIASRCPPATTDERTCWSSEANIEHSLIPKEYYVVKNKGVLGLEYYEDKYTTLLEDDEKKLRLFPSMKPSGRVEVLQLMKVMESMLKKAGVDNEALKQEGPTQMHNLLELLKTEQNIYNIVFHELIRQVSVECRERGELLARLRQQYVLLLDKIPRQVLSLHNDLLAQRSLDRCLTEEIIRFRNSIGELTNELYLVREHDVRVSKEAQYAQEELAKALRTAKKNANLLQEYRELYELQRGRLETQVENLTEEKDLWSSATYKLARKVIEANQLQLARRLYLSENSWTKVIRHFIVLLASTDTTDLSNIQRTAETWREHTMRFEQELERNEESGREKLKFIRGELEKWQRYFQEKVFVDKSFQGVPDNTARDILKDVLIWQNMLTEEMQQFEGDLLLGNRESLKAAADIQKQWVDLGETVLRRHQRMNGELAPEYNAMEDLNSTIYELYDQYRMRVEGDNGVAGALTIFFNSLKNWSLFMQTFKDVPQQLTGSDWSTFCHLIPDWITQADNTAGLIGSLGFQEQAHLNPVRKVQAEDVYRKLHHWVLATTNGTEKDDVHLTQEATNIHTAMVQFMVTMLILLSPDYSNNASEISFAAQFEEEAFNEVTAEKVQEEAVSLSERVNRFTFYITSCCQKMVEKISMEKSSMADEDSDNELRELETIKHSCNEWIDTCHLILSDAIGCIVPSMQLPSLSSDKKSQSYDSMKTEEETDTPISPKMPSQRDRPEKRKEMQQDVMKVIGHDGNIHDKMLRAEEIAVSSEGTLKASRPGTPQSTQAFEYLTSLQQLQNRLLFTEQRAQRAEEESESLNEQLRAALLTIQELEKRHQRNESSSRGKEPTSDLQIAVEETPSATGITKLPQAETSKHSE